MSTNVMRLWELLGGIEQITGGNKTEVVAVTEMWLTDNDLVAGGVFDHREKKTTKTEAIAWRCLWMGFSVGKDID